MQWRQKLGHTFPMSSIIIHMQTKNKTPSYEIIIKHSRRDGVVFIVVLF